MLWQNQTSRVNIAEQRRRRRSMRVGWRGKKLSISCKGSVSWGHFKGTKERNFLRKKIIEIYIGKFSTFVKSTLYWRLDEGRQAVQTGQAYQFRRVERQAEANRNNRSSCRGNSIFFKIIPWPLPACVDPPAINPHRQPILDIFTICGECVCL